MLKNQLKVLLQRVYTGGRKPRKILMSAPLRDALRLEMHGSSDYIAQTFPKDDLFYGIPVIIAPGVTKPIVELDETSGPTEVQIKDLL